MRSIKVHDRELHEVLCKILISIQRIGDIAMTTSAEFTAGFDKLNAATSAIAKVLAGISANLGSMTAAEEDEAKAKLDAAVASLEAMAVTPTDPVPVPVPEPTV